MKKQLFVFFALLCGACLLASCESATSSGFAPNNVSGNVPSSSVVKGEYIDLGLPSGTKWNTINETKSSDKNGLYRYKDAISLFEESLPTNAQWCELKDECTWTWKDSVGYEIVGPNGNSIVLNAEGYDNGKGNIGTGKRGGYWSSNKGETPLGWRFMYLHISSRGVTYDYDDYQYFGHSVRLVENP